MSTVAPSRPQSLHARLVIVVACLLAAVVVGLCLYLRLQFGEWVPGGQPPPRVTECGRRYDRADRVVVEHPSAEQVRTRVGAYPPLVGAAVRSAKGCTAPVPTSMYLAHDGGYVSYGLGGAP